MKRVQEINEQSFASEVLESTAPVVVDVYAPWCGPCRMLAPILEDVAAEFEGRLKVVKINVDEAPQLAAHYGIRGVPSLLIFDHGELKDTVVGLQPAALLKKTLGAHACSPRRIGVCGCSA